jgi:hypothetical protein
MVEVTFVDGGGGECVRPFVYFKLCRRKEQSCRFRCSLGRDACSKAFKEQKFHCLTTSRAYSRSLSSYIEAYLVVIIYQGTFAHFAIRKSRLHET